VAPCSSPASERPISGAIVRAVRRSACDRIALVIELNADLINVVLTAWVQPLLSLFSGSP
jgi:hypothetical protein